MKSRLRNSGYSRDSSSEEEFQLKYRQMLGSSKVDSFVTRSCASSGYWLSGLIPLALASAFCSSRFTTYQTQCDLPQNYNILTILAIGMFLASLSFFIYLSKKDWDRSWKIILTLIPIPLTTFMIKFIVLTSWLHAWSLSTIAIIIYQGFYIKILLGFPSSFTFGEACILVQSLILFLFNALMKLYDVIFKGETMIIKDFDRLNLIVMTALLWLVVVCLLLSVCSWLHQIFCVYSLICALAISATCLPLANMPLPIITVWKFMFKDITRLYVTFFYAVLLSVAVCAVAWQLQKSQMASTSIRKIFHILLVLVYMPGILYQCSLLYLAIGVAFALMVIIELLRVLNVPPLGEVLRNAFKCFADEKDAGLIALTPFCLLIGCSLPLWLRPCPCIISGTGTPSSNIQFLSLMAGVLTIGFGDTAASVLGSKYGRIKWKNGSRTLEGSLAFIIATFIPILILNSFSFITLTIPQWFVVTMAVIVSALVEAHTDQIDNLVLPLIFYIIVSSIG
uniref:dolichol kinase n=1 Tax=Glossina brevipalpis TaxID=37001 RepID=A0A1A9WJ03_9MUSC